MLMFVLNILASIIGSLIVYVWTNYKIVLQKK